MKKAWEIRVQILCDHGAYKVPVNAAFLVDGEWRWKQVDPDELEYKVALHCRKCGYHLSALYDKVAAFFDLIAAGGLRVVTLQQIEQRLPQMGAVIKGGAA